MNTCEKFNGNIEKFNIIIESLSSMYSILSYQKDEIIKTESIINQMQKCLINQNKALRVFMDDIEILEKEKNICLQAMNTEETSCKNSKNYDINRVEDSMCKIDETKSVKVNTLKRKIVESAHLYNDILDNKELQEEDNLSDDTYLVNENQPPVVIKPQLKKYDIPELKNVTIHTLRMFNGIIFYGGSHGMLLRNNFGIIDTYETRTTEDIIQVEVIKRSGVTSLAAFTRNRMIIFVDMDDLKKNRKVHVHGMQMIYNAYNMLFITQTDGCTKRVNKDSWKVSNYPDRKIIEKRIFFGASWGNRYRLVNLVKDTLLYKTSNTDLKNLVVVPGVTNIKMVLRTRADVFLCYSEDTIWFLGLTCEIIDALMFKDGIKFVDWDANFGVVVDGSNVVTVYPFGKSGNFEPAVYEAEVDGDVTAVATSLQMIYIAVGDTIYTFNYEL